METLSVWQLIWLTFCFIVSSASLFGMGWAASHIKTLNQMRLFINSSRYDAMSHDGKMAALDLIGVLTRGEKL